MFNKNVKGFYKSFLYVYLEEKKMFINIAKDHVSPRGN